MKELKGVVKPLKLRALSRALGELMGSYRSAFRGNGLEYDDSRRYIPGDDPRSILWKKSTPPDLYVKVSKEERDLRVTLLLDISASMTGYAANTSPFDIMKQVATLLVVSAVASGDRVALGFFAEKMEKHIPPRRGLTHALSLLESIDSAVPLNTTTNLAAALDGFLRAHPKRSLVFIITDGIYDAPYEEILNRASFRHDVIVINLKENLFVTEIPKVLTSKIFLPICDPETGKKFQIALSNEMLKQFEESLKVERKDFRLKVEKKRATYIEIDSKENPLIVLKRFFERRRRQNVLR